MATKKITELVEIISAANDDVLPIVDISTDITNKIKVENLPISTSVQTALNGKENTIGYTTENVANKSTSVTTDQASNTKYPSVKAVYDWAVGLFATLSQLATKQDTLVSGTNIKTVNSTSLLGSGNVSVQETLVSGTNIRTINSTSLLGSGNISIQANPSGVSGAIQFSDGSAFASDSNLFWNNTNKRLGVGTNTPSGTINAKSSINPIYAEVEYGVNALPQATRWAGIFKDYNSLLGLGIGATGVGGAIQGVQGTNNDTTRQLLLQPFGGNLIIGSNATPSARTHIVGSGTTSATTALLVQNSANTSLLTIRDNGELVLGGTVSSLTSTPNDIIITSSNNRVNGNWCVGNGGYNNASSILQADSTTKGFLPPRMTTTQKNAITSPASGLQVYDTTLNQMSYYNGSSWINF